MKVLALVLLTLFSNQAIAEEDEIFESSGKDVYKAVLEVVISTNVVIVIVLFKFIYLSLTCN